MASAEEKADRAAALAGAIHDWQIIVSKNSSDNAIEAGLINGILPLLKGRRLDPYLEDVQQSPSTDYQPELDKPGTNLWNACREASIQCGGNKTRRKSLSAVQGIAASMINRGTSNTITGHIRVLKAVFPTVRFLLENLELKLALGNLTIAASRLEALRLLSSSVDSVLFQSFNAEYCMLRVKLSCIDCRSDLAEYHYSQLPPAESINNTQMVIETCYEIACDPLFIPGEGLKIRWLQRAVRLFDDCNEDKTRGEQIPAHVGLTLRHTLVRAYLAVKTEKAREKLLEHLKILKMDHGTEHAVLFLQLDVIRDMGKPELPDIQEYFTVLNQISTTMELTASAVNLIMSYINLSAPDSGAFEISAFKELVLRLAESEDDLIEHCFLCFACSATESGAPEEDKVSGISEAAKTLHEKGVKPLRQAAAHAAMAFVWKQMDTQFSTGQFLNAQKWCRFLIDASSMLLLEASDFNKDQAKKKYVSSSLKCMDIEAARKVIEEISPYLDPESGELDPKVMWLQYLVHLHTCDIDNDDECACQNHLSIYPTLDTHDLDKVDYLQGCVMAAHDTGRFSEVMKAIYKMCSFVHRLVIENDDGLSPSLRAAEKKSSLLVIYVLSVEIKKGNLEQGIPDTMAHHLGIAANRLRQGASPEEQYYTADEVRWICQKCFNLSWILIKNSKFALCDRLETAYSALSRAYGTAPIWLGTVPTGTLTQIEHDKCRLFLLQLAKHTALARLDDDSEPYGPAWHYSRVSNLVNSMENSLGIQRIVALYPEGSSPEMNVWVAYMEASFFLRDWPEAARGLFKSCYLQSEDTCRQVMSLLLRMDLPRKMKVYMIRRVFCGFWEGRGFPRWMTDFIPYLLHVLFELCTDGSSAFHRVPSLAEDFDLESRPHNMEARANSEEGTFSYLEIAELVLDQALTLIDEGKYLRSSTHQEMHRAALETEGHSVCHNLVYPPSELAYLARASFNQAMDFYSEEKDEDYKRWAEKAIKLAEKMENEDGANLVQLFKRRLEGLV
ncbi:uncharacterized protein N7483_003945 [Penicillium malachiteum]|uniref:uncharacterized protein n=1 Tax=Penicillium malachiteum TaxID=1324776 RepID=UPI002546BC21|nr:uncharacterized protein N7483_003945 [Penicillium malachiteum]KAJ5729437.1 hypothetical protein N7483_003945 [Penicillium malachiteum]